VSAYRPKHLVQDIAALVASEGAPLDCLVAHDWGGAVAWSLANQLPHLTRRLAIINSPHPGTFLRELQSSPEHQQASAYMNFLIRPDAEKASWRRTTTAGCGASSPAWGAPWLTEAVKQQYRDVWDGPPAARPGRAARRLQLLPRLAAAPAAAGRSGGGCVTLPREMLTVDLPTLVLWAMDDAALLPAGRRLDEYIPRLTLERVPGASHWIVHERPPSSPSGWRPSSRSRSERGQ
jgi:pimeloyl-ACP methyl ester carboxylesterase